jgi:hypothetical protein
MLHSVTHWPVLDDYINPPPVPVQAMLEAFVHDPLINWRLLNATEAATEAALARDTDGAAAAAAAGGAPGVTAAPGGAAGGGGIMSGAQPVSNTHQGWGGG